MLALDDLSPRESGARSVIAGLFPMEFLMAKFLGHVTCGVENPSKAALAFLVAKTALDEKHEVTMFLASDAAQLLRPAVIENLTGLGTGTLKAHLDAIVAGGGKLYVSGKSAKSRGFDAEQLSNVKAEFAMPAVLVRLAADADKVLCY
jgi:predicted peroxiredoxin